MKKTVIYVLCVMLSAGMFSACKRVASENRSETIVYKDGSTVTKSYRSTPPDGQVEQPKEEAPKKLFNFWAKRLLRKDLKKDNGNIIVTNLKVGYYECNSYQERLNLYKLVANNLITLKCDEIVTKHGSTYWVTVELTPQGQKLIVNQDVKKRYPEDLINEEEAKAFLVPALDQDMWGVPSVDSEVPQEIVSALKNFYAGLQAGRTPNQSLLDANMTCALSLLDSMAYYGASILDYNPFTRGMELTFEMVENLSVLRLPRMQDAYLVTIGENSFVYIIDHHNGVYIDDVAYVKPSSTMNPNHTVCALASNITKWDLIRAREAKRERDARAKQYAALTQRQAAPAPAPVREEEDEICKAVGGLQLVEHDEPTLYEIAKQNEHFEEVVLLAAVIKITKIYDLEVTGNKKEAYAEGVAIQKLAKVTAVGRIYEGLEEGETHEGNVSFTYTRKDGWKVD